MGNGSCSPSAVLTPAMNPSSSKLHLGCFDRPVEGWVNTDVTPHIWVARIPGAAFLLYRLGRMTEERYLQHSQGIFRKVRYLNVAKRFPYPTGVFGAVFSSHMLEHLYPEDAEFCLAECLRVLAPRGICRVVVPDLDILISNYDPDRPEKVLAGFYEPTGGGRRKNAHRWLYNADSLIALLSKVGFQEARKCEYQKGQCPDIDILDNRPDGSLFVEGIK
jgi:SAM-dependent methyltransferase